jgi:hypothetical protein
MIFAAQEKNINSKVIFRSTICGLADYVAKARCRGSFFRLDVDRQDHLRQDSHCGHRERRFPKKRRRHPFMTEPILKNAFRFWYGRYKNTCSFIGILFLGKGFDKQAVDIGD